MREMQPDRRGRPTVVLSAQTRLTLFVVSLGRCEAGTALFATGTF